MNRLAPFDVTVTFTEEVSGFAAGDVTVANGNAGNLRGSGAVYTVAITPDGAGDLEIGVAADVAADAAGNGNTAAASVSVAYDAAAPGVQITGAPATVNSLAPFDVTVTFTEVVSGFDAGDVSVINGNAGNLRGSGAAYTVAITPDGVGNLEIFVAGDVAADAAGNGNTAAASVRVAYDADAPGVAIEDAPATVNSQAPFDVTVRFTEAVIGFDAGDVTVANGNADNLRGSGAVYRVAITPDGGGDLEIGILGDVARDAAGNGNTAAASVSVAYDAAVPGVVVSENEMSVEENDGTATYTMVLDSQPTGDVTITPTSSDPRAATVPGPLTFTPQNWQTEQTMTVTGVNDDLDNPGDQRSARIRHAVSGGGYDEVQADDVSVTVIDDDTSGVTLSRQSVTVAEAGGTQTYTLVLDSQPAGDVTITPTSSDPRAAAVSGSLTFTPQNWQTEQTVTVTGVNDDLDNPGDQRSAKIRHAVSGGGYDGVQVADVAVTVSDDDDAPPRLAGLTISPQQVEEGSEPVMVTVTARLAYAVTTDTDVTVTVGGGESTATVGSDYIEVAPFVLRIPVGAASARGRFELIALDDRLDEAEETIRISARIDAGVASAAEAHMRLVDNDDPSAEIIAPALTRFGRTVGEQAVDAITARMVPNRALGFSGRIAGHDIRRCDPAPRKSDPDRPDDAASNAPAQNERIRPCDEAVSRGTDALQTLLSGADATLDRADAGSLGLPGNGEASSPGRVQGLADMLAGTSFSYLSEIDSGARMGFWGKGVLSRFDGTHGETNLTGKVSGAMLGTDWQMDDRLIGLMISRSHGDIDYRFNSNAAGKGSITADLTAFVPYVSFRLADRLQGWFAPGYGLGSMTLKPQEGPENGSERQVPINWYMLAAGLREALVEPSEESGPGLDLTADFLHTQTSSGSLGASEALPALAATSGMTQRLRVGFDARWKGALPYGDFTPHLDVALRHDIGDADTGRGVEIGGGFRVSDPGLGLDLDLSGRTLALHEEGDFENWGLGLSLAWDPAPETKRGWSVRLRHDLGDVSGGQAALLAPSAFPALQETDRDTGRWSAEAAYGASLGQGLVGSPYTALSGNDASDRARLGYRIEVDARHAPDLSLDLWAEPEIRNDGDRAGVELRLRW